MLPAKFCKHAPRFESALLPAGVGAAPGGGDAEGGPGGDAAALQAALKEALLEVRLLQADNDGLQETASTYKTQLQ